MAPSTFASAAAGNNNSDSSRQSNSGEWNRRTNGATQTFRRPSLATNASGASQSRDGSSLASRNSTDNSGVYIPPHRNGALAEHRYSKEQLLQLFHTQHEADDLSDGLSSLFVGGWEPNATNGSSSTPWSRREDSSSKDYALGADICWEREGASLPLGLNEMTEDEKELFAHVNSTMKPPTQAASKDGTPKDGASLRKSSLSHANSPSSYSLSSPTSTRPSNRRRDTSDAFPFPTNAHASPASSRFSRDESNAATPPPALLRRRTDFKELESSSAPEEKDKDKPGESGPPFGGLKRSTTGSFAAGANTSASSWSTSQGGGFSPMGSFGSFALGGTAGPTPAAGEKRPALGSMRSSSRFKDLMSKDPADEKPRDVQEKTSLPNLGAVTETEQLELGWNEDRPTSNDTDRVPEDELRTGSAALGGGVDTSPPRSKGFPGLGSSSRQESRDDSMFGIFGMTSDTVNLAGFLQHRGDFPHQTPQTRPEVLHEPMSPTDTNPYQSPDNEKSEPGDLDTDGLPGLGGFGVQQSLHGLGGFGPLGRGSGALEAAASDRSQTSSTGPRGIPAFGTLGGLSGLGGPSPWSAAMGSIGTPTRDRSGFSGVFGESLFSSAGDGLAGLGSSSLFGTAPVTGSTGSVTIGRTSANRVGPAFSPSVQEQLGGNEPARQSLDEGSSIDESDRQQGSVGSIGKIPFVPGPIGAPGSARDESPFRSGRGAFEDGFALTSRSSGEPTSAISQSMGSVFQAHTSSSSIQPPTPATATQPSFPNQRNVQSQTQPQTSNVASPSSNQPPVAQVRQMVMPDRMKWVYKDPDGNTQGPFSGLEMHDWYKAGFFTPELLIKKLEDPEYEPLAQLIRRIGNSREPFLVPQIGVPHDPPVGQRNWSGSVSGASSGAQPPFANSFPSFGTTLTAEQQNALERRKQEEQYLMARQKEHLAQQQLLMRQQMQMQIQGQAPSTHPSQLHHHSSAHSLHSQPSFGSITSPGGYQASPTQGPIGGTQSVPGFFESSFPTGSSGGIGPRSAGPDTLPNIREEELPGFMERLSLARQAQAQAQAQASDASSGLQQQLAGPAPVSDSSSGLLQQLTRQAQLQAQASSGASSGLPQQLQLARQAQAQAQTSDSSSSLQLQQQQYDPLTHGRQVQQMHIDRLRIQEQARQDSRQQQANQEQQAQTMADRLHQFQELRAQQEQEQQSTEMTAQEGLLAPIAQQPRQTILDTFQTDLSQHPEPSMASSKQAEPPSLTEQVQRAQFAKEKAQKTVWNQVDPSTMQPIARQDTNSPMPAPIAQRKQNVADTLTAESRSQNQTPSVETPSASIAPWAKESIDAPKGPSLKEIQEMEAKKAAQQEELAAAARKAAFEKELQAQTAAAQPAPGLPSTSTWASNQSPANSSAAAMTSVWAKPTPGKPGTTTPAAAKKTLAQIQKEEEARKQKLVIAAQTAQATGPVSAPGMSSGKTYAGLAGKGVQAQPVAVGGGAWTTVGAGGKAKAPAPPIPTGPARSIGGTAPTAATGAKAKAPQRSTTMMGGQSLNKTNALEEFKKWAAAELKPHLNKDISNATDFVEGLLQIGSDTDIITEAVHSSSNTIESRHFAEEFMRRRKLADKGVVDSSSISGSKELNTNSGGGWSEVAKKNPVKEESPNNFKVVAGKKKGGRK